MEFTYIMDPRTFTDFVYPEVKDLCKHFLTLVSGILVFSITFSEKIIDFQRAKPWERWLLLAAWAMFFLTFIGGGASLTMLFVAAGRAREGDASWGPLMETGGIALFLAGGTFCLGLLTLAISGALVVLRGKAAINTAT